MKFTIFETKLSELSKIHSNGTPLVSFRSRYFHLLLNLCIYYNKLKSLEVKILTMMLLYITRISPLVDDVLHLSNEFTMYISSDDVILPIS